MWDVKQLIVYIRWFWGAASVDMVSLTSRFFRLFTFCVIVLVVISTVRPGKSWYTFYFAHHWLSCLLLIKTFTRIAKSVPARGWRQNWQNLHFLAGSKFLFTHNLTLQELSESRKPPIAAVEGRFSCLRDKIPMPYIYILFRFKCSSG